MANRIKKSLCLLLTVTMIASLFVGCGKAETRQTVTLTPMDTETEMTLSYLYWEDQHIVKKLVETWSQKYPNITINQKMTADLGTHNQDILNLQASKNVPDVFWVLNSPESMIKNGLLMDMSLLWEADPDTKDVIGGINEFDLGYFTTKAKWTTPVKFFPTCAFLNLKCFEVNNKEMPEMDWTWEDFEGVVEELSNKDYYGISEAVTVITWYPIASDPDCIGEFGWDGEEFDLTNWADGLDLEAEFINQQYKAPTTEEELIAKYGDNIQPQDKGLVAMRTDNWWCWERYWNDSAFFQNEVYFVPYAMPHTEDNQDSKTQIATMDFGGIYSMTEHPREAYEVLKYFTWGADGWNDKLDNYDEIRATAIKANADDPDDTTGGETINNCPITLDEGVWEKYEALHPQDGKDVKAADLAASGISGDRGVYFEFWWEVVKSSKWACYGSQQMPGFGTFLDDYYFKHEWVEGQAGIENAVIKAGFNPADAVDDLNKAANDNVQSYISKLKAQIQ